MNKDWTGNSKSVLTTLGTENCTLEKMRTK